MRSHHVGLVACFIGALAITIGAIVVVAPLHDQQRTLAQLADLDAALQRLDTAHVSLFAHSVADFSDADRAAYAASVEALRRDHKAFLVDTEGYLSTLDSLILGDGAKVSQRAARRQAAEAQAAMIGLQSYWGDALRYHGHARLSVQPLTWWMGGVLGWMLLTGVLLAVGCTFAWRYQRARTTLSHVAEVQAWMFEHHPLPMLRLRTDQTIEAANTAFTDLTGHAPQDVIDQVFGTVVTDAMAEGDSQRPRRCREHSYATEAHIQRTDGQSLHVHVFGLITTQPLGGDPWHQVVLVDRTREHAVVAASEARVAHIARHQGAVYSMASHVFSQTHKALSQLAADTQALRPMVFPGRESALPPLIEVAGRTQKMVAEAQAWVKLHEVKLTQQHVNLAERVEREVQRVARRYPLVHIEWQPAQNDVPGISADNHVLTQLLRWLLEDTCERRGQGVLLLSLWSAGGQVGITMQAPGNERIETRPLEVGTGSAWAALAADKLGAGLQMTLSGRGEASFALHFKRAGVQARQQRYAA